MEDDDVAIWQIWQIEVVLFLKALLNFWVLRVAVEEVFWRILLNLVVDLGNSRSFLDTTARIQKQKKLRKMKKLSNLSLK
jgi:hypothetical protein